MALKVSAPNGVKVQSRLAAVSSRSPRSAAGGCAAMSPEARAFTRTIQVYNVSGGKSLPQWISETKKKALMKDEEFRRRVELIQARRISVERGIMYAVLLSVDVGMSAGCQSPSPPAADQTQPPGPTGVPTAEKGREGASAR